MEDAEPIRESVAFHCQQAAEKYLKAFLVWRGAEFPKTHSIGQLLDLLMPIAPELAKLIEDADMLTPFGVEIRYPGDFPEIRFDQEQVLFALATRVREALIGPLGLYLRHESR
jgi:HEPN domain-containing protein